MEVAIEDAGDGTETGAGGVRGCWSGGITCDGGGGAACGGG